MKEKKLYIIAGPNGAGKTTASFTILPEILQCEEFVNADEIARGLSPFHPELVNLRAGRLFLHRINKLIEGEENFAFETTLSTRSFVPFVHKARNKGFSVSLIFFWLETEKLAINRVERRVEEGGHHIPTNAIIRRYNRGIKNLLNLYIPIVDRWMIVDNSGNPSNIIVSHSEGTLKVVNHFVYNRIRTYAKQ